MSRKGRNGRSNKSNPVASKGKARRKAPTVASQDLPARDVRASAPEVVIPARALEETPPPALAAAEPAPEADTAPPRSVTPLAFVASELLGQTPRDSRSIPPVDLDTEFFDAQAFDHDTELRDPRLLLKLTPMAAQRRAHLAKYVKAAVAVSTVLCLAAFVKVALSHNQPDTSSHREVAAAQAATLGTPSEMPPGLQDTTPPTLPDPPPPR